MNSVSDFLRDSWFPRFPGHLESKFLCKVSRGLALHDVRLKRDSLHACFIRAQRFLASLYARRIAHADAEPRACVPVNHTVWAIRSAHDLLIIYKYISDMYI